MPHPADSPTGAGEQLRDALLAYVKTPGKYHVALREPALLFASVREVLQVAAGRDAGASRSDEEREALRRAACFFTRTALLAPGADHYSVMGLDRNFDHAELKDRYRLLMRLIHPDFSGAASVTPWPDDAAVRVNQAYETLSSSVQRREYDARLTAAAPPSPAPLVRAMHRRSTPAARRFHGPAARSRLKQLAIVCSVAGGVIVLASLVMSGPDEHLVQKQRPAPETVAAAVQASTAATADSATATAAPAAQPAPAESALAAPQAADATPAVVQAPSPASPPAPALAPALAPSRAVAARPAPVPASVAAPVRAPVPVPAPAIVPAPAAATPPAVARTPAAPSAPAIAVSTAQVVPSLPAAPVRAEPADVAVAIAPPPVTPAVRPAPMAVATPQPPAPQPAPQPVPQPPRPAPIAGLTLAEAQPLLATLLQQLESGRGDRLIDLLERDARRTPGAQALSRQYDGLVDGMRPVRLSHVEFKAEPGDGRLFVTGHIRLHVGEQAMGSLAKKLVLRAEFASREGTVVMTGLSGLPN